MAKGRYFDVYCGPCASDTSLELIPVREFCESKFITRWQLSRLVRLRVVLTKKFKNKWYVVVNPKIREAGYSFEYYLR